MPLCRSTALVLVLALMGCGGGEGSALPEGETAADQLSKQSTDQIKAKLKTIVDSGAVGGSSIYGMDVALKSAGKEALIPELNKLMKAKKADDIKKIAQGIIDKL